MEGARSATVAFKTHKNIKPLLSGHAETPVCATALGSVLKQCHAPQLTSIWCEYESLRPLSETAQPRSGWWERRGRGGAMAEGGERRQKWGVGGRGWVWESA